LRAIAVLLALVAVATANDWPFGPKVGFARRDLYNLGLLGAKVADAEAPPPSNEPPQKGKRRFQVDRSGDDAGPERLRVELLYPEGPAATAGVVAGDVIVGVGTKRFSKEPLAAFAKALLKAESSSGKLVLLVQKGGAGKAQKVEVAIPVSAVGKAASKPTKGAGRKALADGGLAWLAKRQQENGGFKETLSGKNGAVVQTSLAGLAWLGGGSDLENGPHKDNVRRAAGWVADNVTKLGEGKAGERGTKPSWSQSNWGYAHAAIFLGELHARTADRGVLTALHYCAKRLLETQESSGGWAHGPGGPNALGYVELNIVTGLALGGLGLAQQSGFEVPKEAIQRAEDYLIESGSGDGGVGYSTKPGQKGQGNIGRSAGTWLGYLALGRGKKPFGKKLGAYSARHADEVLGGHASLMQHILLAGVAAHVSGKAATKRYWAQCERDLVLARAPDGSFQPRPWSESLGMGSNSDVTFGEVWTTAAWAVVLVSQPTKDGAVGFPAWSGAKKP
jgi:hypothetical protein